MASGGSRSSLDSDSSASGRPPRSPAVVCHYGDVSRWHIFSILREDMLRKVHRVCVFGSSGNEAIFITRAHDVYAMGSNCSSCLGLGDTHSSFEPRRIETLCGKISSLLIAGDTHSSFEPRRIETLCGKISSLLIAGDTHSSFEPRRIETLCGKKILDIAFGSGPHVLVVIDGGEVWTWGHNGYCQLGNGSSSTIQHSTQHTTPQHTTQHNATQRNTTQHNATQHNTTHNGVTLYDATPGGEVWSWGHNGYCQLGNGSSSHGVQPVSISFYISHEVKSVACGSHHSMALTAEGEVYAWGQNNCGQVGNGTTANQPTPRRVSPALGGHKAVAITCGQTSSLTLLENGEVYGWGYNGNGQLGLGNNVNQPNPCRLTGLQGVVIRQLVCGYAHTLALSDKGELYSWGANSYGQLGTGNKANLTAPAPIAWPSERFVEVAATHYSHVSAAMTQTGRVLMWGQCRGQSITTPTPTRFLSTDDVFATVSAPPVTWRMYTVDKVRGAKVMNSIAEAFDDPDTSDLRFQEGEREIHVHKAILKIRSQYYRSMFHSNWNETEKESLEVPENYTFTVFRAYLQYLYTDCLDLSAEDAISLLELATSRCEDDLKLKCEEIIRQSISETNVAMLYAASMKYQAKSLEEFCFQFALNHMTAVTQTEAFACLDSPVMTDFIRKAAEAGAFRS
ncbi:hypothetical protein ACOMHN_032338 [Nucella lapillus]